MPSPFPDAHVTRADLERLITPHLERAAEMTAATIRAAGRTPEELAGIFLVGGSSRIPLVSQLVHKHCGVVPTMLDQPETVVARGALRAVSGIREGTGPLPPAATVAPRVRASVPPRRPPPRPLPALPPTPPVSNSKRRSAFLLTGAAALAAALAIVLVIVLNRDGQARSGDTQTPTTTTESGRLIAQYEYQFTLPDDWIQTGGDPNLLRTEVKPADAQAGDDLVLVQQIRLSFDSSADRRRAVNKLRDEYAAAGDTASGFDEDARYAGRQVIHYQQALPNKDATVDWYIVFQRTTQVSIGCQRKNAGSKAEEVSAACEMIVRTLRITA